MFSVGGEVRRAWRGWCSGEREEKTALVHTTRAAGAVESAAPTYHFRQRAARDFATKKRDLSGGGLIREGIDKHPGCEGEEKATGGG